MGGYTASIIFNRLGEGDYLTNTNLGLPFLGFNACKDLILCDSDTHAFMVEPIMTTVTFDSYFFQHEFEISAWSSSVAHGSLI